MLLIYPILNTLCFLYFFLFFSFSLIFFSVHSEMLLIYPILNTSYCIMTKWTRYQRNYFLHIYDILYFVFFSFFFVFCIFLNLCILCLVFFLISISGLSYLFILYFAFFLFCILYFVFCISQAYGLLFNIHCPSDENLEARFSIHDDYEF